MQHQEDEKDAVEASRCAMLIHTYGLSITVLRAIAVLAHILEEDAQGGVSRCVIRIQAHGLSITGLYR